MNEVIKLSGGQIEEYEKLLLEKEDLLRECEQLAIHFLKTFGDRIKEQFYLKVECIRKKKQIAYCQKMASRGQAIDGSALDAYIEQQMKDYEEQLKKLHDDIENSHKGSRISEYTIMKIKKIYRRLIRLIHPDMNPAFKNDPKFMELFNRVTIAYRHSQLKELEELEGLVNAYLKTKGMGGDMEIENLDEKIAKLKEEITSIKENDPYQYKFLFEDDEAMEEKRKEYDDEIENYRNYSSQLDELLGQYKIERRFS